MGRNMSAARTDGFIRNIHSRNPFDVTRNEGKQGPSLPYIPSGSFAKAMLIEGADANASVTGNESTVPMQLRITGLVEMPNSKTYDATGCFVGLEPAINRLWGWGIIAQFAYYLAGFPWYEGNILFAFAVAAQVLTWCETRSGWRTAAAILLMALWGPLSGTSYGIAGLLMLAVSYRLYRAEDRAERLALLACLLAVIPALNLASSDAAAVAGLVMTVLTVGLVSCAGKSLPRFWPGDFFPVFYACHLAVLGVLAL